MKYSPTPLFICVLFIFSHTFFFLSFYFIFFNVCTWLVHEAIIGGRARGGIVSCFVLAFCVYLYVWCL